MLLLFRKIVGMENLVQIGRAPTRFLVVGKIDIFRVSSRTVFRPLSRFDTHPQATLGTFETKMAARNDKRFISVILWKIRGLLTAKCLIPP